MQARQKTPQQWPKHDDGGHWYDRAGNPCYEQVSKSSGRVRNTTLRDARKLLLVPSVTTVLGVLAKPQLEVWKVKQGILAALTLPRKLDETDDAYLARCFEDSKAQAIAAAEEGTRIHDACENAVKGLPYPDKYRLHVSGAMAALANLFPGVTDWVAEMSFADESGYGGKIDLHSPSTGIVADYKSTDERFGSEKRFHYDQYIQLAAYQDGLKFPRTECANIFVSRTEPGVAFIHKWSAEEIEEGSRIFKASLALWKLLRKFDPAFTRE